MAAIPMRGKMHSFYLGVMFHKGTGIYAHTQACNVG